MIVLITLQLEALILAEAGLSFLGLGIDLQEPAWGAMVDNSLRDALDPRLRGLL